MVASVHRNSIYYEGHNLLKPGFTEFFGELRNSARRRRCSFQLVSGGSREQACRDFGIAIKKHVNAWNILLIDSEGPDTGKLSEILCQRHGWDKPQANSVFWMVQMMESWFHADLNALETFYGQGFRKNALKPIRRSNKFQRMIS